MGATVALPVLAFPPMVFWGGVATGRWPFCFLKVFAAASVWSPLSASLCLTSVPMPVVTSGTYFVIFGCVLVPVIPFVFYFLSRS